MKEEEEAEEEKESAKNSSEEKKTSNSSEENHVDDLVEQMKDSHDVRGHACTHGLPDLAPKHSLYQWLAALEREAERFFDNEEIQKEVGRLLENKKDLIQEAGHQGKIMDFFGQLSTLDQAAVAQVPHAAWLFRTKKGQKLVRSAMMARGTESILHDSTGAFLFMVINMRMELSIGQESISNVRDVITDYSIGKSDSREMIRYFHKRNGSGCKCLETRYAEAKKTSTKGICANCLSVSITKNRDCCPQRSKQAWQLY